MSLIVRNRLMFLGAYILLIAVGVSQIWLHQSRVQLGYELRLVEAEQVELKRKLKVLEISVASQKSPQNLRKLATKHGFVKPQADQILRIELAPEKRQ